MKGCQSALISMKFVIQKQFRQQTVVGQYTLYEVS